MRCGLTFAEMREASFKDVFSTKQETDRPAGVMFNASYSSKIIYKFRNRYDDTSDSLESPQK